MNDDRHLIYWVDDEKKEFCVINPTSFPAFDEREGLIKKNIRNYVESKSDITEDQKNLAKSFYCNLAFGAAAFLKGCGITQEVSAEDAELAILISQLEAKETPAK